MLVMLGLVVAKDHSCSYCWRCLLLSWVSDGLRSTSKRAAAAGDARLAGSAPLTIVQLMLMMLVLVVRQSSLLQLMPAMLNVVVSDGVLRT